MITTPPNHLQTKSFEEKKKETKTVLCLSHLDMVHGSIRRSRKISVFCIEEQGIQGGRAGYACDIHA